MFSWLLDRGNRTEELERELAACQEARDRLEARLEATDDRRREAVRDRQAAQEERNRLQDRIEQLEADLARAGDEREVSLRGSTTLDRGRARRVLDLLASVRSPPEGLYSAMVEAERPADAAEVLGDRVALLDRVSPALVYLDADGLVEVALRPPMAPDPFEGWADRFRLERSWFVPEGTHHLAVVRRDVASLGRFDGSSLTFVDGFESRVQGRHSKGGFSQARFERRREEQVEAHLDDVRDLLSRVDGPLVLTGSEAALEALEVDAMARETVDASGGPREVLDAAFEAFWTTRLFRL
ncbi:MAG: Vms1/Ankzf1 family peptidyl-tRNA hydrolase [Halobacteriales archaeon]